MTSKRIKKKMKTSKFVALLLLFKNREKELYPKTNDIQNTRRVLSRGLPTREREKQTNEEMTLVVSQVFLVRKKKFRFHVKRKHTKQAEKEKKRQNNTRRLTSSSQDGNTLHPFWRIHSFARKANNTLVLFFFVREEIR